MPADLKGCSSAKDFDTKGVNIEKAGTLWPVDDRGPERKDLITLKREEGLFYLGAVGALPRLPGSSFPVTTSLAESTLDPGYKSPKLQSVVRSLCFRNLVSR